MKKLWNLILLSIQLYLIPIKISKEKVQNTMKRYTCPNCNIIDIELENNFVYSGTGYCLCSQCKFINCPHSRG